MDRPGRWRRDVRTALGRETVRCRPREITAVEFRNGKLVYLSDLEPTTSEEVAYFGRPMPHARDKTLLGEPLKLAGKGLSQGIAVHRADRTHLLHWVRNTLVSSRR